MSGIPRIPSEARFGDRGSGVVTAFLTEGAPVIGVGVSRCGLAQGSRLRADEAEALALHLLELVDAARRRCE